MVDRSLLKDDSGQEEVREEKEKLLEILESGYRNAVVEGFFLPFFPHFSPTNPSLSPPIPSLQVEQRVCCGFVKFMCGWGWKKRGWDVIVGG